MIWWAMFLYYIFNCFNKDYVPCHNIKTLVLESPHTILLIMYVIC